MRLRSGKSLSSERKVEKPERKRRVTKKSSVCKHRKKRSPKKTKLKNPKVKSFSHETEVDQKSLSSKTEPEEQGPSKILIEESCHSKTPKKRDSTFESWLRLFKKYSPSKETLLSPIKALLSNLEYVNIEDDLYLSVHIWVINMSESIFYDNTLLLLSTTKASEEDTKNILRRNFKKVNANFFKKIKDITLLGQGTYGSVFSGVDPDLKIKYAIKYIKSKLDGTKDHFRLLIDYMSERNAIIRSMSSPFITKFYYSFQVNSVDGLFLFFEFCIGDLNTFILGITDKSAQQISVMLKNGKENIIQSLDKSSQVLDISLLYIFELFCALDFLVQVNIIHQDIKPSNLLISESLHLKIADFGIIYKTKAVHRESNVVLVEAKRIKAMENVDYQIYMEGTPVFMDFENLMMSLEADENPLYDKVKKNVYEFGTPGIKTDRETLAPTFLIDTWAAGVTAVSLLLPGFIIFDPQSMPPDIYKRIPRSSIAEFAVFMVATKTINSDYISRGLIKSGGEEHKELMHFISSIFRPRAIRARNFTKEKQIYKYSKLRTVKYIDIEKVENIQSFKARNFNSKNVFTLEVPKKVADYYQKPRTPNYSDFFELLFGLSKKGCGKHIVHLKPGINIKHFI